MTQLLSKRSSKSRLTDGRVFSTASAPADALIKGDVFSALLSTLVGTDPDVRGHSNGGGNGTRSAEWYKSKIIASSFLVHCRERKQWSQKSLAEALGVTAGYIGQIESLDSRIRPPLEFLIKVATVTGTPFELTEPTDDTVRNEH